MIWAKEYGLLAQRRTMLDKVGQSWTKLDKVGQSWTKLDKVGHLVFVMLYLCTRTQE